MLPNMALVTSKGSRDPTILFIMSSYPCGPILGLQKHAKKEISVRTYKRLPHIFIYIYSKIGPQVPEQLAAVTGHLCHIRPLRTTFSIV